MKVLQLIDSLNPGGAESLAVNIANGLHRQGISSYLSTTRTEGPLRNLLEPGVEYLFLKKRSTFDLLAIRKLRRFVMKHEIGIIHAHTTSYFFATLLKRFTPGLRIIWHEHFGNRVNTKRSENKALFRCSKYFDHIITVNNKLKSWCEEKLKCEKVTYVPNFVQIPSELDIEQRSEIIICVANLRHPKNHLNLLRAFKRINSEHPGWKLQLVGKRSGDAYENEILDYIKNNDLQTAVPILGLRNDVGDLLSQASIGVLSSDSEGLPMSLLEYGAYGLAVVTTKAGMCEDVIGEFGKTVPPKDADSFYEALNYYLTNKNEMKSDAGKFNRHIIENYSDDVVLDRLIEIYKNVAVSKN